MKRILFVCFVVCAFTLEAYARPQNDDEDEDYATDNAETDNADIITHPLTFVPIINQTMLEDITPAAYELPKFASQCLYDHKGKRVNKDCDTEKPPKCEKGHVVSTSVGDEYEMCCCNYSNFL